MPSQHTSPAVLHDLINRPHAYSHGTFRSPGKSPVRPSDPDAEADRLLDRLNLDENSPVKDRTPLQEPQEAELRASEDSIANRLTFSPYVPAGIESDQRLRPEMYPIQPRVDDEDVTTSPMIRPCGLPLEPISEKNSVASLVESASNKDILSLRKSASESAIGSANAHGAVSRRVSIITNDFPDHFTHSSSDHEKHIIASLPDHESSWPEACDGSEQTDALSQLRLIADKPLRSPTRSKPKKLRRPVSSPLKGIAQKLFAAAETVKPVRYGQVTGRALYPKPAMTDSYKSLSYQGERGPDVFRRDMSSHVDMRESDQHVETFGSRPAIPICDQNYHRAPTYSPHEPQEYVSPSPDHMIRFVDRCNTSVTPHSRIEVLRNYSAEDISQLCGYNTDYESPSNCNQVSRKCSVGSLGLRATVSFPHAPFGSPFQLDRSISNLKSTKAWEMDSPGAEEPIETPSREHSTSSHEACFDTQKQPSKNAEDSPGLQIADFVSPYDGVTYIEVDDTTAVPQTGNHRAITNADYIYEPENVAMPSPLRPKRSSQTPRLSLFPPNLDQSGELLEIQSRPTSDLKFGANIGNSFNTKLRYAVMTGSDPIRLVNTATSSSRCDHGSQVFQNSRFGLTEPQVPRRWHTSAYNAETRVPHCWPCSLNDVGKRMLKIYEGCVPSALKENAGRVNLSVTDDKILKIDGQSLDHGLSGRFVRIPPRTSSLRQTKAGDSGEGHMQRIRNRLKRNSLWPGTLKSSHSISCAGTDKDFDTATEPVRVYARPAGVRPKMRPMSPQDLATKPPRGIRGLRRSDQRSDID